MEECVLGLFQRPHVHQHLAADTHNAQQLLQRPHSVLLSRQVVNDRDADCGVEGGAAVRHAHRVADHRLEATVATDGDQVVAPVAAQHGELGIHTEVLAVATADVCNDGAGSEGSKELLHAWPRLHPRA